MIFYYLNARDKYFTHFYDWEIYFKKNFICGQIIRYFQWMCHVFSSAPIASTLSYVNSDIMYKKYAVLNNRTLRTMHSSGRDEAFWNWKLSDWRRKEVIMVLDHITNQLHLHTIIQPVFFAIAIHFLIQDITY